MTAATAGGVGRRIVRVMLLVTDHERGGTPLRLARLAVALHAAGVEVHAGCLAGAGPVTEQLAAAGIPTFTCGARTIRDIGAFRRLARHIRHIRPDLIHAALTHANVAARVVGGWLHVPVIGSTATIEVERRWHRWLEALTTPLERAHFVNSAALQAHVTQNLYVPTGKVVVLPVAAPTLQPTLDRAAARVQLELPPDAFVVAWHGRLDRVKRLPLVIQTLTQLVDLPTCGVLAGDGPERPQIEQRIRTATPAPPVRLLGWCAKVANVLVAADAYLFPSQTEGLPNAVVEALATGLPVVASDLPALRELQAAGAPLRLIAGDNADAFAAALREIHALSPAERRALRTAAFSWVQRLPTEADCATATVAAYERVLHT